MRQVAVTALALLLALFLLPLLLVPQGESPLPVESGNLPIDRTVVTPEASLDSGRLWLWMTICGGWWLPRCPLPLSPRL